MEGHFQTSTPKLKLFNHSGLTHDFFRISKYKERLCMTKFGSIKVGDPSQTGFPKFKNFNRLNQKAKIFRTGDYERWRMAKFLDTTL